MFLLRAAFLPFLLLFFLRSSSVQGKVELSMDDGLEAYQGDSATVSCRYNFTDGQPGFVMIQWFVRGERNNFRVRIFYGDTEEQKVDNDTNYTGRIQVRLGQMESRLTVQNVQPADDREFFCQVNGLAAGNAEGRTHLRVFAPPEPPVIEGVLTGISVTNELPSKVASCEARHAFPKPNITWYRNGAPLVPTSEDVKTLVLVSWDSSGFFTVQSTLEYKVTKEDKDALFSCEVSFFVPGAVRTVESSRINITVHYPTTMVYLWQESPQGLVKEGDTVELRCQGDGNPPPSFVFSRQQEPDVDLDSSGEVLVLSRVSRGDSGVYRCRPRDAGVQTDVKQEVQISVHYLDAAVVVPKDSEVMLRGEDLTASCNALSSLETSTSWFKDGRPVGRGTVLHLLDATFLTSGEYVCQVTVPSLPSLNTSGAVHIIVQGGPELVGAEPEVQLVEAAGRTVNLSCEVLGYPPPSITWSIMGSQSWQEVMRVSDDHMTRSVVSVEVTSDISAACNASNDMGADSRAFSIRAIPRVTTTVPFSPADGGGVIIVVIILSLLLLAVLGSVVYFLHKKGKFPCGRSGKQEITAEKTARDDIVVEMKTGAKNEEAVLLKSVNGDKTGPNDQ